MSLVPLDGSLVCCIHTDISCVAYICVFEAWTDAQASVVAEIPLQDIEYGELVATGRYRQSWDNVDQACFVFGSRSAGKRKVLLCDTDGKWEWADGELKGCLVELDESSQALPCIVEVGGCKMELDGDKLRVFQDDLVMLYEAFLNQKDPVNMQVVEHYDDSFIISIRFGNGRVEVLKGRRTFETILTREHTQGQLVSNVLGHGVEQLVFWSSEGNASIKLDVLDIETLETFNYKLSLEKENKTVQVEHVNSNRGDLEVKSTTQSLVMDSLGAKVEQMEKELQREQNNLIHKRELVRLLEEKLRSVDGSSVDEKLREWGMDLVSIKEKGRSLRDCEFPKTKDNLDLVNWVSSETCILQGFLLDRFTGWAILKVCFPGESSVDIRDVGLVSDKCRFHGNCKKVNGNDASVIFGKFEGKELGNLTLIAHVDRSCFKLKTNIQDSIENSDLKAVFEEMNGAGLLNDVKIGFQVDVKPYVDLFSLQPRLEKEARDRLSSCRDVKSIELHVVSESKMLVTCNIACDESTVKYLEDILKQILPDGTNCSLIPLPGMGWEQAICSFLKNVRDEIEGEKIIRQTDVSFLPISSIK